MVRPSSHKIASASKEITVTTTTRIRQDKTHPPMGISPSQSIKLTPNKDTTEHMKNTTP